MKPSEKIISLMPMEEIEQGAITQLYDVAKYDFVKKIAVMPDVHQGYFLPIGGVALVEGHIVPEMVGYDIGCGMCFVNTGIPAAEIFKTEKDKSEIMMMDSDCFVETVIDECPDVYKDLNKVIKYQEGIVIDVVNHISPLVNVKG